MKKRILSAALALAMIAAVIVVPTTASAASGTCGSDLTWSLNTGTGVLTISGTGDMANYYPLYSSSSSVTIKPPWYNYRTYITSLVISNGATSIGDYAFYYCESLTSISISSSVTSIGNCAFYYCESLTSISIPDSVTSIGSDAFFATSLESITIPDSVTSIGSEAFYYCTSLTSISISDSVTSIGGDAFYNTAYYRNNANWTDGVLYVGNHIIKADSDSISDSYEIRSGTVTIADYAFKYCDLTNISVPDSVTSIGSSAFYKCTSLTSISIPDSVISIGDEAFYGCTSLENLNIFDGVTTIGDKAFYGGTSLTNITIPNSVISIGNEAFYNTAYYNNSSHWTNGVLYIGNHLIEADNSLISDSYGIHTGTVTIADKAFYYCTSLASISIPGSVISIGYEAFYYCTSLTSISIPNSVTSIGSHAFYNCTSLASVDIPDGVTNIGTFAFYNCTSLTSISIPNSVTSIAQNAFYCSSLTSVYYFGSATAWNQIVDASFRGIPGGTIRIYDSALDSKMRFAVSDIGIEKWDSDNEIYTSDYDALEVFDECTFSVDVIVPADTALLTFDKSDWECTSAEESETSQSTAIDFGEVSVLGPYALEDDADYSIYYVSVTGELEEKGDFTLTFNSPNGAVSSTDISIERYYKMGTDNWTWQHPSFVSVASDDVRPFYMSSKAFYRIFPQDNAKSSRIYSKLNPIIDAKGKAAGMCNGLAVSSAMIYLGMPSLDLTDSDAEYANDVLLSDIHLNLSAVELELHEFIEAIHASQYMEEIAAQDKEHKNNYSDLLNAVLNFEQTGDKPVAITISSTLGHSSHVLIGYKAEKTDDEYKVYVYDCNYPNDSQRYITFPLNSSGNPTGWSYTEQEPTDENDQKEKIWGSDKLGYITYEDDFTDVYNQLLSTAGMELKSITLSEENTESSDLIVSTSDNFTVTVDGQSVSCAEGAFSNEENTSLIPVIQKNYMPDTEYSFEDVFFYCGSETALTIENDSDSESVSLSMIDDNAEITITSDGHSVVETGETDDMFNVAVTPSRSGNSVTITYTTADGNIVVKADGIADDCVYAYSNSSGTEIQISGYTSAVLTVTNDGGLSYSEFDATSDEGDVLVKTSSNTLSVWADRDGDGEYESEITSSSSASDALTYEITSVNTADGHVNVEFEPLGTGAENGAVLAAAYNAEGELVGIDFAEDVSNGSAALAPSLENAKYVRVYIWDELCSMKPLADYVEITVE